MDYEEHVQQVIVAAKEHQALQEKQAKEKKREREIKKEAEKEMKELERKDPVKAAKIKSARDDVARAVKHEQVVKDQIAELEARMQHCTAEEEENIQAELIELQNVADDAKAAVVQAEIAEQDAGTGIVRTAKVA